MKILFSAIKSSKSFEIKQDLIAFSGKFEPINQNLVKCKGKIYGEFEHICDKCGKNIIIKPDLEVDLNLSDGVYKDKENELSDTIEFFDGQIDLDEVLNSEIEAYKSDYFYCDECKILKGE